MRLSIHSNWERVFASWQDVLAALLDRGWDNKLKFYSLRYSLGEAYEHSGPLESVVSCFVSHSRNEAQDIPTIIYDSHEGIFLSF